jgi:hypothetical protein
MRYTPAVVVGTVTGLLGGYVGAANTGYWAATGGGHMSMMILRLSALAAPFAVGAARGSRSDSS